MKHRDRILVVDDDPINLTILEEMLGDEFALELATNGEMALEKGIAFRPDLVLLDVMMPGIDGFETCRRFRCDPRFRNAKILLLSARSDIDDKLEGYDAGADDFVAKPFEPRELMAKVDVFLRMRSLEQVASQKRNLLTLLNHETRTPLTCIVGSAELLREVGFEDEEERKEVADIILQSANRLHSLFEKVTLLTRFRIDQVRFDLDRINLVKLFESAVEGVTERATENQIAIETKVLGEPLVSLDVGHMRRVLESLLDNAIKFSEPGGQVLIESQSEGDEVTIRVVDHGQGIAPEYLGEVFEEFTVQDILHHSVGHGLSLALAKEIVEGHGGSIGVESEPGNTVFTIELSKQAIEEIREKTDKGPAMPIPIIEMV